MEFNTKQTQQLKQFKNLVKLHKLQAKCEEFKGELENVITERIECLGEREQLMEHLTSLQGELKIARNEEYNWQHKLDAAKISFADHKNDNLQNICVVLGYQITKFQPLESNGVEITLNYRDICYVTYSETSQLFNLLEIYPQHPNFAQIQQFLQNSQDLRGLLSCLRAFFDFAIDFKEKQEQENM
ncbi:uncharacterized protein LOC111685915 [Lucilia cuprina]|uniref:uncharacterized protein LOC111685915 n=1 Tax=Lucilia cuprina TaxID=7375 RepID=UPI001F068CA5|nr:uncharacterized protein LOC111685915 [Lucilia cuprina]